MSLAAGHLSRQGLRSLAVQTLLAAGTAAGERVYDPNTLPQNIPNLPTIVVSAQSARKETAGTGNPKFNTNILLAVMVRVAGLVIDQKKVQADLDTLVDQVEDAILCTPSMVAPIQRIMAVDTHTVLALTGSELIGEGTLIFTCEVPQDYLPNAGEPLTEIDVATRDPAVPGPGFRSFLTPSP